ncbi:MAG: helix-turn-helix transcriptional regulator [Bacteroidales bacterium]|nr:helix-turn-helix transcriptional regulator [Bacteroidales bacterium]
MQIQKPEIREKILARSMSLFYMHGFEKTTMRQIGSGIGMSVSNLYKYFRNKEVLFDELVSTFILVTLQVTRLFWHIPKTMLLMAMPR